MPHPPDSHQRAVAELREELGEKVTTNPSILSERAHDRSYHHWQSPLALVRATSTEDVSTALRICHRHHVPVVPRGSGTGLEGGANTSSESICIDVSGMKQLTAIAADDLYATAEAGVMKSELNAALAEHGLHFAAGPGVDASVGGMAATSASGTTAVHYGTLKENTLALTVVLADGSVIKTGSLAAKSSAGYDLTHLFVGSEGTLGIITEVTLRLYPLPAAAKVGVWSLPSLHAAVQLVLASMRTSLPLARVELLDELTISALQSYSGYTAPRAETLMVEFVGGSTEVNSSYAQFAELAGSYGASEFDATTDPQESKRIWQARHDSLPAAVALIPGARPLATDVCVPISQLPECILETKADLEATGLVAPLVGHVGDGNFHLAILLPPDDPAAWQQAKELTERLVTRALAHGGTSTGEHGVGIGKVAAMAQEHSSALMAMRAVKQAFDPRGIMNPGKVLDGASG